MASLPIQIADEHVQEVLECLLAYKPKPPDFTGTDVEWASKILRDMLAQVILSGALIKYNDEKPSIEDYDSIITV